MLDSFFPFTRTELPKKLEYGEIDLSDMISAVFENQGIKKLYKHQSDAIKQIRKGNNVIVSTPTASGKTEIYLSEVVDAASKGKTSLLLYPTKALSRDQLEKFQQFSLYGIRAEIYDGDTPDHKRKKIRMSNPQILITNVDMLHHILINNKSFRPFLDNLKFVVLDELHIYSGVLGAHASNILWRLKRLTPNKPQFIATSATINNSKEFAEKLFGEPAEEIKGISAKRSKIKHFIIVPEEESYLSTTVRVVNELKKKCLIFGNSHSVVERLSLIGSRADVPIYVYRGGLNYEHRKKLEQQFKKDQISYLATTSALELGIDIGNVDAIILSGFPGTITRVKQRIGRAGRKGQDAYAVFVAKENPLDYYYVDNIDEYIHGDPESCFVNSKNKKIRKTHILCAARDKLLKKEEIENKELLIELETEGMLRKWADFYAPTKDAFKIINHVNIRGIGDNILIYDADSEKPIGERSVNIAIGELYPGAMYLHGGRVYLSESLDLKEKKSYVRSFHRELSEYTQPMKEKNAEIVKEMDSRTAFTYPFSFGQVHIVNKVYGFRIKDQFTGKLLGESSFKEPYLYEFDTYGVWLDLEELAPKIEYFPEGLHAFEHVAISMIPSITGADPNEVGGLSYSYGKLFIYDGVPDGNGVTDIVFQKFEKIAEMAINRIKKCDCIKGCPKCILDPSCGNDNRYLSKESARELAEALIKF